jgi:hypothetical protein
MVSDRILNIPILEEPDDCETSGTRGDFSQHEKEDSSSSPSFFFNYEEEPRSLFFLNIHGGIECVVLTTQETENISHQVHLLHLLIEFKRLAEGLAGGCQGQQTLL